MYYIGNIRYFLSKKGYTPEKIEEVILKFKNDGFREDNGDDRSTIVAGAPPRILGEVLGKEFADDFNKDRKHIEICINKGLLPA
jgi:hypothetical protein